MNSDTFLKGFVTGCLLSSLIWIIAMTNFVTPRTQRNTATRICEGLIKHEPSSHSIEIIDDKCFVHEFDGTRRPLRFPKALP